MYDERLRCLGYPIEYQMLSSSSTWTSKHGLYMIPSFSGFILYCCPINELLFITCQSLFAKSTLVNQCHPEPHLIWCEQLAVNQTAGLSLSSVICTTQVRVKRGHVDPRDKLNMIIPSFFRLFAILLWDTKISIGISFELR